MRELVKRYFDNALTRRGFARKVAGLGFTAAAAASMAEELEAAGEPAEESREAPAGGPMQGTGGELLVAQARAAGTEYLFTNPGSFEVGLFDAWVDQPGLETIVGLHEGIVISMADGYHRVSLKPAFVNVHVIAGTAQAAGQLYNASRDGSALVVTAGLNDNEVWSDETILAPRPGFDQKEVPRQFTKIAWEARQAESLPMMLRRAFKVATTAPGGPVYLAMAHYALETKNAKAQILPAQRFLLGTKSRPEAAAVEECAKWLVEAKNPLIVTGDEVWKSGAQAELLALSEKLGIAVTEGNSGYKNFPTRHAHHVGAFSMGNEWVKRGVDVIVMVGARDPSSKVVPKGAEMPNARIVRIGMDTATMGRNYATDLALVGDVKESLKDLRAAVESLVVKRRLAAVGESRSNDVRGFTTALRTRQAEEAKRTFGRSPIHPDELGAVLTRTIDANAIVVAENITGRYDAFPFGFRENEQTWVSNTGLGLGWGVGASTGAKLAAPDRQVVCTIGDGSVMYSASGFWTQVRSGIRC